MPDRDFWFERPTLVTGASGLAGRWLVRRLRDLDARVICLCRDSSAGVPRQDGSAGVTIVRGDVTDPDCLDALFRERRIATVMHLAAQAIVGRANRDPAPTLDTNIRGTWLLLEACRRGRVEQIVLASSDKAYGESPRLPIAEDAPLRGRHPYDVSKSCADLIAQMYANTFDLPVIITRCGNYFGGGDLNWNRIVPGTIRSILQGTRPVIRSDGQSVRDYLYIEDGAAVYTMLAERLAADPLLAGSAFNFSLETRMTALEMVRRILDLMASDLEPDVRNEVSGEIRQQSLDATRARTMLGWRPTFTLEDGLRRTIDWYRQHQPAVPAAAC
ncbi:MAG: NAD-dependent epimerase/dehydratase family protein [Planctomycetota bacterium]|jgi:CDP-glucose 4,6-dehydratase